MPPKQRPDPVTLDDLCAHLTSKTASNELKAFSIVALNSVAFHTEIKNALVQREEMLRAIALFLVQRVAVAHEVRYDCLSLIGELCRREDASDAGTRAEELRELSKAFCYFFASLSFFGAALSDLRAEGDVGNNDVAAVAQDLLDALPLGTWTKEQKEKCKDLMFLDATTDRLHLVPFVSRHSKRMCSACGKAAAPGVDFNRCAACKCVFYCSVECQRGHWGAHKTACAASKKNTELSPELCFPTRHFIYDRRPEPMRKVRFDRYFMEFFHQQAMPTGAGAAAAAASSSSSTGAGSS